MTRSESTVDACRYDHSSILRWLKAYILRYPGLGLTSFLATLGMAASQRMTAVMLTKRI